MSETKRCKGCSDQSGQEVIHPLEAFRLQKAHNGKHYPAGTCIETERRMVREKKLARYATEEGRKTILENNNKYLNKPEVKERISKQNKDKYANDEAFRLDILAYQRDYNDTHRAEKKARAAKYYQENKERINAKSSERKKNDVRLVLRDNLRKAVWRALNERGYSKSGESTFAHMPYSVEDLKSHVELNFEPGMSWDNIGLKGGSSGWQLDHIIPQVYFDFTTMDCPGFKLCWSLKNLRPLNADDNARDGNRSHLFGDFKSFTEIQERVLAYIENPASTEAIDQILLAASRVTTDVPNCPMSNVGLKYLDSLFKDRFAASTKNKLTLIEAVKDSEALLDVLVYLVKNNTPITEHSVVTNLKFMQKTPGHFFPIAAQYVVQKYVNGGSVFDPFVGWGGRCLGTILANAASYTGTDLQPGVIESAKRLSLDFKDHRTTQVQVFNQDALEFMKADSNSYDLIFSSPPYADTEDYNVDNASMSDDWLDTFVLPFVDLCKARLKSTGHLALHLKDIKGAPVFTAYHMALISRGFKRVDFHIYGRNIKQGIYVYRYAG